MNHNKITAGTKNKIIKITLSKNTIKKIFKEGKIKVYTCTVTYMQFVLYDKKKPQKQKKCERIHIKMFFNIFTNLQYLTR